MRTFTLLVACLLCAAGARSQDQAAAFSIPSQTGSGSPAAAAGYAASRWQLAVGYQYNRINLRGLLAPFNTNGVNVSVTRFFSPLLGIDAEMGGAAGSAGPRITVGSIFAGAGPRFAYRRRNTRLEPWVHALFGFEQFNFGGMVQTGSTASFAWTVGGGLDYRLDSGLALRAQGDYLGTNLGGTYQRHLQIVAAIVKNF